MIFPLRPQQIFLRRPPFIRTILQRGLFIGRCLGMSFTSTRAYSKSSSSDNPRSACTGSVSFLKVRRAIANPGPAAQEGSGRQATSAPALEMPSVVQRLMHTSHAQGFWRPRTSFCTGPSARRATVAPAAVRPM